MPSLGMTGSNSYWKLAIAVLDGAPQEIIVDLMPPEALPWVSPYDAVTCRCSELLLYDPTRPVDPLTPDDPLGVPVIAPIVPVYTELLPCELISRLAQTLGVQPMVEERLLTFAARPITS